MQWLNELEWVGGQILANIWMTDCLVRVDPASGAVTGWADLKASTLRCAELLCLQKLEGLFRNGRVREGGDAWKVLGTCETGSRSADSP